MTDYQISRSTMALVPIAHERLCTKIIDRNGIYYSTQTAKELLELACYDDGCTMDGKRKAVTYTLRINQKIPLPINPRKNIYAFPTTSPDKFDCIWIFVTHIQGIISIDKHKTLIRFKNNEKLIVHVSKYIIEEQQKRTTLCMLRFGDIDQLA
ncbi:competence protein ComK [Ferdinandcohnia quinoae]|nr:competence protein ComK [Fredinandcohnia sp. SECRCQ15]